ncbi:non-homologous end-joining DNA ligase [Rhizobium leguminosarum]
MTKPPRKSSKPLLRETDEPVRSRPRRRRDPAQPNLPFDPMPERIEPCLALLKQKPPKGPQWAFEVKWDGYRLAIHIEPSGVRILTRGGHDWTHRFPSIEAAAKTLPVTMAILDGEAIVLDEQGRSDFGMLQQALGGRGGRKTAGDAIAMVFDLLYLDGHDLKGSELSVRRHLLEGLVPAGGEGGIRLSEEVDADGEALLRVACQHGLEGIIAKDRDSAYRSGRLGEWVKIKCIQSDSFFIVGYELSVAARGRIGSLLLAARKGDDLVYVGSVGTGFKESEAWKLRGMMDRIKRKTAPIAYAGGRNDLVWLQPTLIAEIEYRAWTSDGKLRHASYKGLRDRQDNAVVYEVA